jgi:hypothetical protein
MEYKGKLYGKVGKSYMPLVESSHDIDLLKNIVDSIAFEPTMDGSVFKPKCGYHKFHELLNEYYERQNKSI